jgi:large subunit ribosomal protein L10
LNRNDKSAVIDRLRDSLSSVPSIVVTDFKGLTVESTEELRAAFRAAGVHYEVVKNTLVKRAIAGTEMEGMASLFKGNSAIAFHGEDPSIAAKIIKDFAKKNEKLVVKGGYVDGNLLDEAGVIVLSTLPGKDELRAQFLSVLAAMPTKFVRTLAAAPTNFVQVLMARQMQLEEN